MFSKFIHISVLYSLFWLNSSALYGYTVFILFIHFGFPFWVILNNAIFSIQVLVYIYIYIYICFYFLIVYVAVGLQGHMITLCSTFGGTPKLVYFCKPAALFYTSTSSVYENSNCSISLLLYFWLLLS